jgi:hypothetical protein
MNQKLPLRFLIIPPIVAALVLGTIGAVIASGAGLNWKVWGGLCAFLGYGWMTLIILERFNTYKQDTTRKESQALLHPQRITLDLRTGTEEFPIGNYIDLPEGVELRDIMQVAQVLVVNGFDISYATMAGPGKPLMRSQFETLRDWLIQIDMVAWVNPYAHGRGVIVTRQGQVFLRQLATHKEGTVLDMLRWVGNYMRTHTHTPEIDQF